MTSKVIGFNTRLVLPIVVVIVTIVIGLVLQPEEPTILYWVNLGFGLFWEFVFFGWLTLSRSNTSEISSIFKAVSGGISLYYVLISFIVMFVYSIVLTNHIHIKWYICALVILTIIWYTLGSLVAHYDNSISAQQEMLNELQTMNTLNISKVHQLSVRYSQICKELGEKYDIEVNTQDPLGRLFHKYQFISPNVLMNSTTMLQLNTIITTCDELLINLECAKDKEAFNKAKEELEHFVKAAIADIDFIKNTTRS